MISVPFVVECVRLWARPVTYDFHIVNNLFVLQRLESELRVSREPELLRIRDKVQSIVTVAGQGGAVELTAVMSRLNIKFAEVQQRILAANSKFQAASSNLAACRSM